ncbi:uncharacterized protein LOC115764626 isoform X1 [Drosophila novamexicana]|uniref:uncharacterized protein LOC115764626 isoform X1 n=1 Tax=Drosophila novamexicana TaxID=47314 RepID=UPI0011E5C9B7|nr:uncharacterized protein LOC115764626 isoform X1 [Drosophila novamexicana]
MRLCNFVLDVIVTKLKLSHLNLQDPHKLQVQVKFNKMTICLSASKINVTDFKPGSGTNFEITPEDLRQNVEKLGMSILVKYDGFVVGTGQLSFPNIIIERIAVGMTDLIHSDTCKIERNSEVVGTVELLCRLIIKCDDEQMPLENNAQYNVDKNINEQDILFLLSESQPYPIPCEPCQDTLEDDEGDERLKLDLQRYRSSNACGLRDSKSLTYNSTGNAALTPLKKLVQDCKEIIDSIIPVPPCRKAEKLRSSSSEVCYSPQPQNSPCFSYLPTEQYDNFCSPRFLSQPINDGRNPHIMPIRFCPVCLNNMSWLPIFASCPKCGVKPIPVVDDPPNEKELTAEQILIDFLGKPTVNSEDLYADPHAQKGKENSPQEVQTRCRCSCEKKLCAHCRIRKLCADIFKPDERQTSKLPDGGQQDYCVKSDDSRPHLAKVFSDLRDLYYSKDMKRGSLFDDKCEGNAMHKVNMQNLGLSLNRKRKAKATNQSSGHKELNYHSHNHNRLAGHKTCANKQRRVPRRHGWAWSSSQEARNYGWKPGAVLKPIKKLMNFFLYYSPPQNAYDACMEQLEVEKDLESELPILNVCKKKGEVFITLRAVSNKHVDMKPIVFKIVKSNLAVALSQIKKKLKEKGFPKCICHKTVMMCVCRNNIEKKHLEGALQKECKRRGIENCVDHLVLTDTSDSEVDYDFDVTPPACVAKPRTLPKPLTVNNATQCTKKNRIVLPNNPFKRGLYWRAYDCATGDRYTGTAFGAPAEEVFEDGVFGYRGGGAHGANATLGGRPKNKAIWGNSSGGPMRAGGRSAPYGNLISQVGEKSFPGAKRGPAAKGVGSKPIPVKMTKRAQLAAKNILNQSHLEKTREKTKSEKMIMYLKKHGLFLGGKDKEKGASNVGPDGITDAQRRRRALLQVPPQPIEFVTRLGKGFDPCTAQCNCEFGGDY